jgi:hypothetical protein
MKGEIPTSLLGLEIYEDSVAVEKNKLPRTAARQHTSSRSNGLEQLE